ASALDAIELPATDNPLPRRLHQQAGLSSRQLEKSAATLLDVDTPTDAALLVRHPACPPELQRLDAWQAVLADRIEALMRLATKPLREFTEAARDASFPLLLGGHTLVSGAFWTMVEAAWHGHPDP